jgi:hypothetical protein
VIESRPRLLLSQAISALILGRLEEAEQLIDMADAAPTDDQERHDPSVGRSASLLANVAAAAASLRVEPARLRGDAGGERAAAAKAVARLTHEDRVLGTFPPTTSPWPTGWTAEYRRPNMAWPLWWPTGRPPARPTSPCGRHMSWGGSSAPVAGWGRPWEPTAGSWRWRPRRAGRSSRPPAWPWSAWRRWSCSGATWPTPCATPARASACAGSSCIRPPGGRPGRPGLDPAGQGDPAGALEAIAQLVVTLDTVEKHLSHIFDKLGATNRNRPWRTPGSWA